MEETRATVRKAKIEDCEGIAMLIKEMAVFEKMPDRVVTADTLRKEGFGEQKMFGCFVAESGDDTIVGYAMYYFQFSSFEGVNIFMEDLYVTPGYRRFGLGKRLWKEIAMVAIARGCVRLDWVCLDWNKDAIEFYKAKGAVDKTTEDGYYLFRLRDENLKKFASD